MHWLNRYSLLLSLVALVLVAAWLGLSRRAVLSELFEQKSVSWDVTNLQDIQGRRAGSPVAPTDPLRIVRYTVVAGDSWSTIAKRFNIDDYNELARYHNFINLKPGMVLEIPPEIRGDR